MFTNWIGRARATAGTDQPILKTIMGYRFQNWPFGKKKDSHSVP